MRTVYTSNRLENLCRQLAQDICKSQQDVFCKEMIITQGQGMNAWLKTELAKRNKVFANFKFQNQDGFFALLYELLLDERLPNHSDTIRYKVYQLLDEEEFKIAYEEVASYYRENELRRFQLSAKIADLFDQYQLYRPAMVEGWEKGQLSTENPDEKWQKWLWNKLGIESKATLKAKLLERMKEQKELIQQHYPKICLFGITVYTPFHLDFYRELANYTDVTFYLCLPSNTTEYKNELLVSYGSKAEELAELFDWPHFTPLLNDANTLLAQIQNQLVNNENASAGVEDDSLQINSCYTPVREVECLYNYLLDLFDKDRELKTSDVLVMCTDINKYAPYVKAVFRNAPVKIPFQVSGAANNSEDCTISALEKILQFTEEDLTSEKVISLLEQKRIREHYKINDCNYLRSVVRKANIRFGRKNREEDDTCYVSWRYGLDKIILGYAMLTDDEFEDKYPFKDAEASASYDLFRLKAFVTDLEWVIDSREDSRTPADWKEYLLEVLDRMIYLDDFKKEDRAEINTIYHAVAFAEPVEKDLMVPYAVFLEELKTRLFTESRESRLNTGRVTFSSPIPVRGLPYKVICFLGLNNDIFPRKDRFMGFDLLGEAYQKGDRNKKETDKYLFLDTLLSAREKLYLSYIGQSVKDNILLPPSIVVDTLIDYIGHEELVVRHPLHGFSARYRKGDGRLFTYLYGGEAVKFQPKEKIPEAASEVSVYSLVKFFEHPIEWYYNNILGIKYELNEESLPECELFKLDHLQIWKIKNDLLRYEEEAFEAYLQSPEEDNELKTYLLKGIKEGSLPLKNLGRLAVDERIEETKNIRSSFQTMLNGKAERAVAIDLTVDNMHITGTINGVYGRQYMACSFSKTAEKDVVRTTVKTLLLCAQGEIDSAVLIMGDGASRAFDILTPDDAKAKIKELLAYFRKGMELPLKFTIHATKSSENEELSISSIIAAFRKEAEGSYNADPNKYMRQLIRNNYFGEFDLKDPEDDEDNDDFIGNDPGAFNEEDLEDFTKMAKLLNLK